MADNQAPGQPRTPLTIRAPQAAPAPDAAAELRGLAASVSAESTAQASEVGQSEANATPNGQAALGPQRDVGGTDPGDQVEVDWGGAKRRMSLRELTEKARATDQATAKAQAVEEMFKKNTAADAFVKMIDAMPEEDQKAFAEVLRNPSLARKLVNGSPSPSQRPAAETTDFDEFTREEAPKAQPQPQNEEFRTLQRGMKVLLEAHQARMQQEQHQTMAQQVEASMNGFPVFSETPSGSKYARQAIMQTIAQNPGAKVDDVVASHAAQLHGLLQEQRQAAMPARNGEMRTSRQYQLPNLEREPTWKDLGSSGGLSAIGRALLERS